MLIVCILLALLCAGLAFWVWAQRRSLREAAYRLRALEDTGSTARVRLAVPNSAAEELLDEVNRLLELRQRRTGPLTRRGSAPCASRSPMSPTTSAPP